jgi:hypothetical protein
MAQYTLEEALNADPVMSEILEITVRGVPVRVQFRELPTTMVDKLRMAAIQYVEDQRRKKEQKGDGEWRDAQMDIDVLRANRLELLMIHAALVNPDSGGPACTLASLEGGIEIDVLEYLGEKWEEFKTGIDPDYLDEDAIKVILDEGRKKNWDPVWLWTHCGFKRLTGLVAYLDGRLSSYQTE